MGNLEEKLKQISDLEVNEDILSVNFYTDSDLTEDEGADLALLLIDRAVAVCNKFDNIATPKFD